MRPHAVPLQQALQVHRDHLAPVPGARDRVGRGRGAFGRDRDRRRDAGLIERAAFQRALDRLGADRRRRHRAIGDARARDAPAVQRQMRGDREHRDALRLHARHLAEAERVRIAGRLNVTLATRPRVALAARRGIPPAASRGRRIAALHRDRRVEREQRGGEVAIGRRREQIAADGRHVADRRPADRARHRMQERELAVGDDLRHRDAGAERDARAGRADFARSRDRSSARRSRTTCRPR